jgi:hypothetical protein
VFFLTPREVAHPGVITSAHDNEEERRYVTYYQWVGFTLFFQVNKNQLFMNNRCSAGRGWDSHASSGKQKSAVHEQKCSAGRGSASPSSSR